MPYRSSDPAISGEIEMPPPISDEEADAIAATLKNEPELEESDDEMAALAALAVLSPRLKPMEIQWLTARVLQQDAEPAA